MLVHVLEVCTLGGTDFLGCRFFSFLQPCRAQDHLASHNSVLVFKGLASVTTRNLLPGILPALIRWGQVNHFSPARPPDCCVDQRHYMVLLVGQ